VKENTDLNLTSLQVEWANSQLSIQQVNWQIVQHAVWPENLWYQKWRSKYLKTDTWHWRHPMVAVKNIESNVIMPGKGTCSVHDKREGQYRPLKNSSWYR